jgi:hypothetical protein
VSVSGVRRQATSIQGGCNTSSFTYTPLTTTVGAGATETLLQRSLYSGGSGCCNGTCRGAFCEIRENFTVVTSVGEVNAGAIGYGVTFRGCPQCSSSLAASGVAPDCPAEAAP